MLAVAFHAIQLFCTSQLKSDQATKTSIELFPAIYMTFALAFLCRTRCDTLNKVLMHCTDIRPDSYSSYLAHLSDALVTKLVCMASI